MEAGANKPLLNAPQRRILAAALTAVGIGILCAMALGVFWLLRGFVTYFSAVLWPLAVAGILALLLRPLVVRFEDHLKLSRVKAIVLLYAIGLVMTLGAISYLLPILVGQIMDASEVLPQLFKKSMDFASAKYPQILNFLYEHFNDETVKKLNDALTGFLRNMMDAALPAVQTVGAWIRAAFGLGTGLAIIPVYLFFFLKTNRDPLNDLSKHLSFLPGEARDDILFLVREFVNSVVAFFHGQILIGLSMGVIMAVGFTLIGLKFGLIIGLTFGVLNIIPYLGTIIGLAVAIPVAYFQPEGGAATVGLTLLVFTITQLIEGYILTPRIMEKSTGLHPLAIIISIFFWGIALEGILGMVLAIPLSAFFVVFWRLLSQKYLRQWTGVRLASGQVKIDTDLPKASTP